MHLLDSPGYSATYFIDAWVAWSKKHASLFTHGPTSTAFMLETLIGHLHESLNLSDAPEPSICKQLFPQSASIEMFGPQRVSTSPNEDTPGSQARSLIHLDADTSALYRERPKASAPERPSMGGEDLTPRHVRSSRRSPTKKSHAKSRLSLYAGKRSPILPCFTGGIEKNYVCAHCLFTKTTIEQFSTLNFKPLALQEVVYIRERFRQRGYTEGLVYQTQGGSVTSAKSAQPEKPKPSPFGFISSIFSKDNKQTIGIGEDNRGLGSINKPASDREIPRSPRGGFLQSLFGKPKQPSLEEEVPILTIRDYLCNLNYTRSPDSMECPKCGVRAFQATCYTLVRAPTVMVVSFIEPANTDNLVEPTASPDIGPPEVNIEEAGLPDPVKRANEIWHREFVEAPALSERSPPQKKISFAPEVGETPRMATTGATTDRSSRSKVGNPTQQTSNPEGSLQQEEIQWETQRFDFRVDETFEIDIFSKAVV